MDKLYIVMPAYNEEENIEDVVNAWYSILDGKHRESKIVIADSGSTDSTHERLLRLREANPQIEILSNTQKQHGPKVIALYDYAVRNGADYIFQTDSDGQTNPGEFEKFWEMRNTYDAVLGNRAERGDGRQRAFVERVVCILLKLYFGVKVPDANAPFRLMKTEIVMKYLYKLEPEYNLPNIMMTTYFAHYHEKLKFVKISFQSRRKGKNSINMVKITKIGWNALRDFGRLKREM